jgi:hypothetical protein
MSRTFEPALTCPVLQILAASPGGQLDTTQLKAANKSQTPLFPGDLAPSHTRNDLLIDQIVGNIVSHRDDVGNMVHDGLVEYVRPSGTKAGTLRITAAGGRYLTENCPAHA